MEKTVFSKILELFKLSFIIFFCSCSVLSASAQNGRITLDMKQVPLEQTMNAIEKQTSYLFVNKDVLITQKVSITVTNASID